MTLLAVVSASRGMSTWLEAGSVITGAVCVWLTVRESPLNFPIGMVNVATFSVVFFNAKLYGDAGLQLVYFVLAVLGWYHWLYGGTKHTALHVARCNIMECCASIAAGVVLTLGLWAGLHHLGGSASFWDALTTGFSLVSQWLLNRKRLESWLGWIFVDIVYVPLYLYKGLHLTAVLYAIFLVMAVMGYFQWRKSWLRQAGAT